MTSENWKTMNELVEELDKLDTDIFSANIHINQNPHSLLAQKIRELERTREKVLGQLDNHLTAWSEKLQPKKEAPHDNSTAVL